MSREDADALRKGVQQFVRTGEFPLGLLHADVEFEDPPELPDPRVYRGHEGFQEAIRAWRTRWQQWRFALDEVVDAGEHVVVLGHQQGRGRSSGADVELRIGLVYTMREGRARRVRVFFDQEAALAAAGVAGSADEALGRSTPVSERR